MYLEPLEESSHKMPGAFPMAEDFADEDEGDESVHNEIDNLVEGERK